MSRAFWADGRAMFTTVASSTTISWASAMKTRAIQRRGTGGPETGAVIDMTRRLQSWGISAWASDTSGRTAIDRRWGRAARAPWTAPPPVAPDYLMYWFSY